MSREFLVGELVRGPEGVGYIIYSKDGVIEIAYGEHAPLGPIERVTPDQLRHGYYKRSWVDTDEEAVDIEPMPDQWPAGRW